MHGPTLALLLLYAAGLLLLSRGGKAKSSAEFLLAGRTLTLPAFVATLVTTWYGGILGVGEFAWRYGLSTWVVFGLPYYIAALTFGFWLAPRIRRTGAMSIPEMLERTYGRKAAFTGASGIWAGTVPVAYLLMLSALLQQFLGLPALLATLLGISFSVIYVAVSGFRAVVRTDALQMALMFIGFSLLLLAALKNCGGLSGLWGALPASHLSWDGGLGWQAVFVWYLIAFQTVVEPAFYQRVFAARSPQTARSGVLVSVLLWGAFDFLSITSALAARVLHPDLADPLTAYPTLAASVLSPWAAAVFTVALFAIVMSTLDSYLFLSASTFGHDFWTGGGPNGDRRRIRIGLVFSAVVAVGGTLFFDSAIDVWHHVGSVLTSSLLIPVLAVHLP